MMVYARIPPQLQVRRSESKPLAKGLAVKGPALAGVPMHHVIKLSNRSHMQAFAGGRLIIETILSYDSRRFPLRSVSLVAPPEVILDLPPAEPSPPVASRCQ